MPEPWPPPLILLVEDEPEIATVVSGILDDAGFRVEVASNYSDGLVLLNASQPALLIANVQLPGGASEEIRGARPGNEGRRPSRGTVGAAGAATSGCCPSKR
jgi:DNA-binding response OmpR family regulator